MAAFSQSKNILQTRRRCRDNWFHAARGQCRGRTAKGSLFDGRTLDGWIQIENKPTSLSRSGITGWIVKDGAMSSTGAGRGVIYTANDCSHFRLQFRMRHVSGNPDHQACVLIFCSRPRACEKAPLTIPKANSLGQKYGDENRL